MNKLGNNTKTAKAPKEWTNLILHLSPMNKAFKIWKAHKEQVEKLVLKRMNRKESLTPYELDKIKAFNSRPFAGYCGKICLDTAGRGKFSNVQIARAAKTIHKILDSDLFDLELISEIQREEKKAQKQGKRLAIRLNGTSDLDWTKMIIRHFPDIIFYDYTKDKTRYQDFILWQLPDNYYLTFSYDRTKDKDLYFVRYVAENKGKIAIMEKDLDSIAHDIKDLANYQSEKTFSFNTINGDDHDLRFFDKKDRDFAFITLKEKGDAKK